MLLAALTLVLAQEPTWETLPAKTWVGGEALFGCPSGDGFYLVDFENSATKKVISITWSRETAAKTRDNGRFELRDAVKQVEYRRIDDAENWRLKIAGSSNAVPLKIDLNIAVVGEELPTATFQIREGDILRSEMKCSIMPRVPGSDK